MRNKKGSATLYVVVGLVVFIGILSYVFSQTANLEIDILTYFGNIKQEYEKDLTQTRKDEIILKLQQDIEALTIEIIEDTEE